jgi:hypothetical protein
LVIAPLLLVVGSMSRGAVKAAIHAAAAATPPPASAPTPQGSVLTEGLIFAAWIAIVGSIGIWLYLRTTRFLPPEAHLYFEQVVSQLKAIAHAGAITLDPEIVAITEKKPVLRRWDDLNSLDLYLASREPVADLQCDAKYWLGRLDTASPGDVNRYGQLVTAAIESNDEAKLRAAVTKLVVIVQRLAAQMRAQQSVEQRLYVFTICAIIIVGSLSVFAALIQNMPVAPVVVFAGAVGGIMSTQQRLQASNLGTGSIKSSEITNYGLSLLVSPITGAIFALVLYLLMVGGAIEGIIFPHFHGGPQKVATTFWEFSKGQAILPDSSNDFALLLVWSFVAGFAERFVPDTIDRLVSRSKGQSASSSGSSTTS